MLQEYAEKYAEDQDLFFKDYVFAHKKLSELGSKFDPPEVSPSPSPGSQCRQRLWPGATLRQRVALQRPLRTMLALCPLWASTGVLLSRLGRYESISPSTRGTRRLPAALPSTLGPSNCRVCSVVLAALSAV